MNSIKRCAERCPVVAGLPEDERTRILGGQALHLCPELLPVGQLGPLCGLPSGENKNEMTREALAVSRTVALSTV